MISTSQWISTTLKLPITNHDPGAGYHENIIYIIGGWNNQQGYIEYDTSNNTFTLIQSVFPISISLSGYGQWWFQMNEILYMTQNGAIHEFNLTSN